MSFSEQSFKIKTEELKTLLPTFAEKGITEFTLQDPDIYTHKGRLIQFMKSVAEFAPDLFVTIPVDASMLDMDLCRCASEIFCSLEIPFDGLSKGGSYLFDKKFFSRRAGMLNNMGLVFGFNMKYACASGDSVRLFRDRLDFAVSLFPNHIDFPQLDKCSDADAPSPSATFSTQDIKMTASVAFACQVFYSQGRAVPWFCSVVKGLGMLPSKFFQDFAEWQRLNNCSYNSGWDYLSASHSEIERMQLTFLKFKYEEKHRIQYFDAVSDIVRLNGALSRCAAENAECTLSLSYNPDDILGPESLNIPAFCENVCMENIRVKIFCGQNGPEYKIL